VWKPSLLVLNPRSRLVLPHTDVDSESHEALEAVQEVVRRREARDKRLAKRIDAHLAWLQKEPTGIEAVFDETIRGAPAWREKEACSSPYPASAQSPHGLCLLICHNWALSITAASPPSSGSPP
jgi:hypothetical protein